jgi:hypothetical protein
VFSSINTTDSFRCAASTAADIPAGPPPTTTTSALFIGNLDYGILLGYDLTILSYSCHAGTGVWRAVYYRSAFITHPHGAVDAPVGAVPRLSDSCDSIGQQRLGDRLPILSFNELAIELKHNFHKFF